MRAVEAVGIGACFALAPGYAVLMRMSGEPVDAFAVGAILAMGVFLTLFATVFRKHTEDTPENRQTFLEVVRRMMGGLGD